MVTSTPRNFHSFSTSGAVQQPTRGVRGASVAPSPDLMSDAPDLRAARAGQTALGQDCSTLSSPRQREERELSGAGNLRWPNRGRSYTRLRGTRQERPCRARLRVGPRESATTSRVNAPIRSCVPLNSPADLQPHPTTEQQDLTHPATRQRLQPVRIEEA